MDEAEDSMAQLVVLYGLELVGSTMDLGCQVVLFGTIGKVVDHI